MNDYERPTVSVRQRIAAINRTIQEEQRKAQNAAGRGAVRIPWRPQTKGSSARSNSINLVQLPQRLARTGTNKSPSLAPIARPPLDRKREAADTARDSLPDKSIRLNGSSTRGRTQTTVDTLREIHTPSNIPRECRPSSRVSDIHREPRHSRLSQISTSSTSSYPPSHLNSDEMYQIYTRYLQCQLCAVRIHETSEKNKQAKQDQLWNMYSELREFKRTADPKSVQELTQLLNEYSVVSKQLQDAAEDLDTKISSDLMAGLVRDLYEILTAVRNTLISNDSMKDVFSIDAEIQMLKECTRLTDAVARAEAEHQSLSAIV